MESSETKKGIALEIFAWLCAAFAFFPAIAWIYTRAIASQQLRDALVILASAALILAFEYKIKPHSPIFSRKSLFFLMGAYAAFFVAPFLPVILATLTMIVGLSLLIISAGMALFYRERFVYSIGGGFFAFCSLSLVSNILDFPLRALAGKAAESLLLLFNKSALLMLYKGEEPQIGLMVDGAPYLVATECNGFGIISSSIVLSIILSLFSRGRTWYLKIFAVVISGLVAFAANTARIACIVAVAPRFGKSHYGEIHEFFGYVFFSIALIAVWIISTYKTQISDKLCKK